MPKPDDICICGDAAHKHEALSRACLAAGCKAECREFRFRGTQVDGVTVIGYFVDEAANRANGSTTGHAIDPNGVNHPRHYNIHPAGIECIDVIEYMTANIAFTIKHLWRAGLKEGEATLKDVDKALWYLNRERARLVKLGVK